MSKTALKLESVKLPKDFLQMSALRIHIVCITILLPFTLNHLVQGRYESAFFNFLIFAVGSFNIWSILKRSHYYSQITLFVLLPAVITSLMFSVSNQGVIGLFSCYAAITGFYFILPERQAWFANIAIMCTSIVAAWVVLEPSQITSLIATLVLVSLFSAVFVNVIYKQQRKLALLAATDTLTGLLNRSLLYQNLEQAIAQNKRKDIPMTIITFDIDHFKTVNDTFGHDVGDTVLKKLGTLLKARVRQTDKIFRLGGEEFMVLLFDTDLEEGQKVAENLRTMIASTPFIPGYPVTVSLGVATLLPNEKMTDWVKRSDEYLYIGKASGRNQVVYQNTANTLKTTNLAASVINAVN